MNMRFGPFIYTPDQSIEVLKETEQFIQNTTYVDKLEELGWTYYNIGEVIPHTYENLFSGHFFPFVESWDELQISFNLCLFGLYKQSMMSLRSGLELGLLSVYWNLNDDGHLVIKQWLKSREDTPRHTKIWKQLEKHHNFKNFQQRYDIRQRLLNLNYLHDYAHSKGFKYSNRLGLPLKPNFQVFDENSFATWFESFQEIIEVLSILHLVKYPIGVIKYDYDQKFGMDKPWFGGLETFQVERIERVLGHEVFRALEAIALDDKTVTGILDWLESLPDITEDKLEDQIIKWDKFMIEQQGLEQWLEQENLNIKLVKEAMGDQFVESETHKNRIEFLTQWAKDNGFEKSALERHNRRNSE